LKGGIQNLIDKSVQDDISKHPLFHLLHLPSLINLNQSIILWKDLNLV